MAKIYSEIDDRLRAFIEAQHVFFVGSAPTGAGGHINVSPKGLDSLRILGPKTVAYLDFVGSGVETITHLRQNGRIVIMLCAFSGPPRIVRLHGRGQALEPQDAAFASLRSHFTPSLGVRAIIRVDLERISDSCGYAVPQYHYEGQRTQLAAFADRKGEAGLIEFQRQYNSTSVDGLPGLRWAGKTADEDV